MIILTESHKESTDMMLEIVRDFIFYIYLFIGCIGS